MERLESSKKLVFVRLTHSRLNKHVACHVTKDNTAHAPILLTLAIRYHSCRNIEAMGLEETNTACFHTKVLVPFFAAYVRCPLRDTLVLTMRG